MNTRHCYTLHDVVLAAVLTIGFASSAFALEVSSFIVDLNTKEATNLGSLGGDYSYASGINDAGQVVGESITDNGQTHAFITGPNGIGMTDLGTLGGNFSRAHAVNNFGQAVGDSYTAAGEDHAFITGPNGVGMTDLGALGKGSMGYRFSEAFGINDAGQVTGYSTVSGSDVPHAFITEPNGLGMTDLGTLEGRAASIAKAVNATGQVTGSSDVGSFHTPERAFITGSNGVGMTDIGALGRFEHSWGNAINASGQVVGHSTFTPGERIPTEVHAFITGPSGENMTDLRTLGGASSAAYGINDAGQVVGESLTDSGQTHAFITGLDGVGMTDLASLVNPPPGFTYFNHATAINNHGQLAAVAAVVPEPETYAMLLLGLGLIGFLARGRATA